MDQRLRQVRKRLASDFEFYSKSALKIRTKAGEIKPLVLNPAQKILDDAVKKQLAAEGKGQDYHLESQAARFVDLHWRVSLLHSVSQQKAQKAMIVTHHADSTRALFDMTRSMHQHCPEILQPHTKYSSRRELSFDVLDSSFIVLLQLAG